MTNLERAIAESKERDEKATEGPWVVEPIQNALVKIVSKKERWIVCEAPSPQDSPFICAARTWEPRWREMVEVAIEHAGPCLCEKVEGDQYTCDQCELKEKLERLARAGLEEGGVGAKHLEGLGEK